MRSIGDIYNVMIVEKETFSTLNQYVPIGVTNPYQSLLSQLTSTSKVSMWRLIFWVCAVAIWIHEGIMNQFKIDIQNLADSLIPGTAGWYINQMKAFQMGSSLTWDGQKYSYSIIDTTKNIITQCAVANDGTGNVLIKVAAQDTSTPPKNRQLTSPEASAALAYLNQIDFVGITHQLVNDDGDLLNVAYNIYVDPSVININVGALYGTLISDGVTKPVETAINNYIYNLDTKNFNGTFKVIDLTDAIQSVPGVLNCVIVTCITTPTGSPSNNILTITKQEIVPVAGWLQIDPGNPLSSTLNYYSE